MHLSLNLDTSRFAVVYFWHMEKEQNYSNKNKPEIKTLIHASGRESNVEISNNDRIGNGHFGNVYRVDASLANEEGRLLELRKKFALKNFKSDNIESADRAMLIHGSLKKAGVKTWTTYRRVKDENSIFMTDGEKDETLLISTSDASRSKNKLTENQLNRIENFEVAVDRAIQDALLAGMGGIYVPPDAWFANFKKLDEKNKLFSKFGFRDVRANLDSIFIGDFDGIVLQDDINPFGKITKGGQEIDEFYYEKMMLKNLMNLKDFLDELFVQVVRYMYRRKYKKTAYNNLGIQAEKIAKRINQQGFWKKFLNRPPGKMRECEYDDYSHLVFKEDLSRSHDHDEIH